MQNKLKLPLAIAIASALLVGCSSNKVKEAKPNPLPKITQEQSLNLVFSQSVSSTNAAEALRLQLDTDNGVIFAIDPDGQVSAYKGKERLWKSKITKQELTAGVEAGEGIVVIGNRKGQLFGLDQATGEQKWTAKLSGAILSPSLIQSGRVITIANDGTVFAHDAVTGQQVWAYKLPNVQFSLRGQPAPVRLDERTVLIGSANAYVYALDIISGVPRFQRRVAISDGRSDIQRLIDVVGDPVVAGQFLVTTSFQGQVTVIDLASQRVVWSEDASSTNTAEVAEDKVFVTTTDGKLNAYNLATGELVWQNEELLNRQLSNPVMLGQNLVVGDLDGVLHLINPASGKLIGRAKTSGEVRSLRVIDNQLYVATRKGALTIWQNR
ncbi:outer membrane protein assembly factor BamB [Acinetobacter courvalinii]|jgi:outer membrane protein assembly factor BamB|uniref:Outer membrane protein assembly factor BamB n=1 Tax=Acinetobacter courvalinii TaxID=280147 RepID=A0AA42IAD2_9GAMM|nr:MULTISPECIES: outer membrane protein assembly factor BamB [Acinetobacter]EXB46646.1 outer membrane assembly lipoprotein YfgL [Acinetobacter baumannii 146457]EYT17781.1 outer membrane assembly lipoprotein YfgL [Acinetobacter sp. 1000160]MBJ8418743.1 outer membrane protein assembly factor BamB [Acinetobacter courvalinii]MBJ9957484.1 outer membrane protein assembly factor BamB [Acinetobacter courvalinii]MCU4369178.1 outer membrane protein assembly factor BamB [Acinetobacter courvalinii]